MKTVRLTSLFKFCLDTPFLICGMKDDIFSSRQPNHVTVSQASSVARNFKFGWGKSNKIENVRCSAKEYAETDRSEGGVSEIIKIAIEKVLINRGLLKKQLFSCIII